MRNWFSVIFPGIYFFFVWGFFLYLHITHIFRGISTHLQMSGVLFASFWNVFIASFRNSWKIAFALRKNQKGCVQTHILSIERGYFPLSCFNVETLIRLHSLFSFWMEGNWPHSKFLKLSRIWWTQGLLKWRTIFNNPWVLPINDVCMMWSWIGNINIGFRCRSQSSDGFSLLS